MTMNNVNSSLFLCVIKGGDNRSKSFNYEFHLPPDINLGFYFNSITDVDDESTTICLDIDRRLMVVAGESRGVAKMRKGEDGERD
jgi:hypothetical protein